jgi:hypothetical protein
VSKIQVLQFFTLDDGNFGAKHAVKNILNASK